MVRQLTSSASDLSPRATWRSPAGSLARRERSRVSARVRAKSPERTTPGATTLMGPESSGLAMAKRVAATTSSMSTQGHQAWPSPGTQPMPRRNQG